MVGFTEENETDATVFGLTPVPVWITDISTSDICRWRVFSLSSTKYCCMIESNAPVESVTSDNGSHIYCHTAYEIDTDSKTALKRVASIHPTNKSDKPLRTDQLEVELEADNSSSTHMDSWGVEAPSAIPFEIMPVNGITLRSGQTLLMDDKMIYWFDREVGEWIPQKMNDVFYENSSVQMSLIQGYGSGRNGILYDISKPSIIRQYDIFNSEWSILDHFTNYDAPSTDTVTCSGFFRNNDLYVWQFITMNNWDNSINSLDSNQSYMFRKPVRKTTGYLYSLNFFTMLWTKTLTVDGLDKPLVTSLRIGDLWILMSDRAEYIYAYNFDCNSLELLETVNYNFTCPVQPFWDSVNQQLILFGQGEVTGDIKELDDDLSIRPTKDLDIKAQEHPMEPWMLGTDRAHICLPGSDNYGHFTNEHKEVVQKKGTSFSRAQQTSFRRRSTLQRQKTVVSTPEWIKLYLDSSATFVVVKWLSIDTVSRPWILEATKCNYEDFNFHVDLYRIRYNLAAELGTCYMLFQTILPYPSYYRPAKILLAENFHGAFSKTYRSRGETGLLRKLRESIGTVRKRHRKSHGSSKKRQQAIRKPFHNRVF